MASSDLGISVIVIAHNRKHYLKQAVNSVTNQNLHRDKFEIIAITNFNDFDDWLKEKGAKVIHTGNISYTGEKIALGFDESNFPIVSFLEDDDLYAQGRLKKLIEVFSNDKVIYYKNRINFFGENERIASRMSKKYDKIFMKFLKGKSLLVQRNFFFKDFFHKKAFCFNISSIAVRKNKIKDRVSSLAIINNTIDVALFLLTLASSKEEDLFFLDSHLLSSYRVHHANISIKGDFLEISSFYEKAYKEIKELSQFIKDPAVKKICFIIMQKHFIDNNINKIDANINIKQMLKSILKYYYYDIYSIYDFKFDLYMITALLPRNLKKKILSFARSVL